MYISPYEFNQLLRLAYRQLPRSVKLAFRNVHVALEEWPNREDLGSQGEGTLFGLYIGTPLSERESGSPTCPDRIIIYRQPILRCCATRAEAMREIKATLWHEVGHYLGLSEEKLHQIGYG